MKQDLFSLFTYYPEYALAISILINIIVAVLGVVPSVFVTAANVLFFGFWPGTFISFVGESIGAFVAFLLYRLGFKRSVSAKAYKYKSLQTLLQAEGKKAFYAIISLRFIPFVPSGIVTFTAAIGKVRSSTFFIASSLGKIPALLIEAYGAYQLVEFGWQGKLILLLLGIYLLYLVFKKRTKSEH